MASEEREQDDDSAAEIRIIRWMYGIKVTGSWFICSERREVLD